MLDTAVLFGKSTFHFNCCITKGITVVMGELGHLHHI